jgi:phage baseplate assembly protein W
MALIKISDVSVDKADNAALEGGYLYKDLFLDLVPEVYYNKQLNKNITLRDVQGSYDLQAIKNSIINIFLTSPGQKILNPLFGLDLRRYLFDPINSSTAYMIKYDIDTKLPEQEPRIELINVEVDAITDAQEYYIAMQINVPSLNAYGITLKSLLNSNGYYVL